MKTRIFYTEFWDDKYIHTLNHKQKLAFNFLLTNYKVNLSGMYELPEHLIIYLLDLKAGEWHEIRNKFIADGKFFFFDDWIRIMNIDKYQNYAGPLNDKAKAKEIELVPSELVNYQYTNDTVSIGYENPIDTSRNKKSEIKNKKQEIKNQKICSNTTLVDNAKLVIEKFNNVYGKSLTAYDPIVDNLAYWMESYSLDDIYHAIENAEASEFWHKIIDHPITLLRKKNPKGENVDYIGRLKELAPDDRSVWMVATDGRKFYTKEDLDKALNDGSYGYRKDERDRLIIFKKIK